MLLHLDPPTRLCFQARRRNVECCREQRKERRLNERQVFCGKFSHTRARRQAGSTRVPARRHLRLPTTCTPALAPRRTLVTLQ